MNDRAWAASARCFVVMFFNPAERVAPAPRMSCVHRELKRDRYDNMEAAISEVMDGIPVFRWRNDESPCRQRMAETGRMKDSLSMTAERVAAFAGVEDGVEVPELPFV